MEIVCECGFKDIPENFNILAKLDTTSGQLMIYIQCPSCDKIVFFQHLNQSCIKQMLKDNGKTKCGCLSHLFAVSYEEERDPEKAQRIMVEKYREFKESLRK